MNIVDDPRPIYASPMDTGTYSLLGLDRHAPQAVNNHGRYGGLASADGQFDVDYNPCAEAFPDERLSRGNVTSLKDWNESVKYPGTIRDIRFYKTAGMRAGATDVSLMIFNDGIGYLGRNGRVRAGLVLDSLHAAGEIPATLAVFINPGRPVGISAEPASQPERDRADEQRSIEYDSLRPDYSEFLLTEIIPLAEQTMDCCATDDPNRRMMIGMSSGGICAFTVAWHHPDRFARVLSHCGSFTNIKGGHNYQSMIRTTPRKPIRVFMQSGKNDIDGLFGNWPLANKSVAQSLGFSGYDYRFEFGVGGHTLAHGGALFADAIRWLLR
ncbi:MAG TPA: esterase family protein [Gammaproteobacteria bacterium]|jgi:enterochelin esterase family protein|nr:esterase family protein [Gammaproteobacteria bacterium]